MNKWCYRWSCFHYSDNFYFLQFWFCCSSFTFHRFSLVILIAPRFDDTEIKTNFSFVFLLALILNFIYDFVNSRSNFHFLFLCLSAYSRLGVATADVCIFITWRLFYCRMLFLPPTLYLEEKLGINHRNATNLPNVFN